MIQKTSYIHLLCILLPLLTTLHVSAQGKKTDYHFVYIALDENVPAGDLTDNLKEIFNTAQAKEEPAIFYLANGNEPIIVKVNTNQANAADFESVLLRDIQESSSHSINGKLDCERILQLIQEDDFVDEEGQLAYRHVFFEFHVGSSFWELSNNERVIATLFFDLNISSYMNNDGHMSFHVYSPRSEKTNSLSPFGIMNPDGINNKISPKTF